MIWEIFLRGSATNECIVLGNFVFLLTQTEAPLRRGVPVTLENVTDHCAETVSYQLFFAGPDAYLFFSFVCDLNHIIYTTISVNDVFFFITQEQESIAYAHELLEN